MRKVVLLTGGLVLAVVVGATVAFCATDGNGDQTVQADACFGRGELIRSWTYTVSEDAVENARIWGGDLTEGEQREARECRVSPAEIETIDGPTGTILRTQLTLEYAKQYYAKHPEELPINRAKQALQNEFVPVDKISLGEFLVPGCDPAWKVQDFPNKRLRLCFPANWTVDDSILGTVLLTLNQMYESADAGLNVHSASAEAALGCADPAVISTDLGPVSVCATMPAFEGQSHHLLLPNGIKVFVAVSDSATAGDRMYAFRIAMSAQPLP